jgi:hypothetical protein
VIAHKKGASSPCVVCEDNPSLNGHLEAMLSTSNEALLNALVIPPNSIGSDLLCEAIALVNFQPEKDPHITYWAKSAPKTQRF